MLDHDYDDDNDDDGQGDGGDDGDADADADVDADAKSDDGDIDDMSFRTEGESEVDHGSPRGQHRHLQETVIECSGRARITNAARNSIRKRSTEFMNSRQKRKHKLGLHYKRMQIECRKTEHQS